MPASKSKVGPPDARQFMDRCLEAGKGGIMRFNTKAEATTFRLRCYTVRSRDAKRNQKLYEDDKDHPLYGVSVYHVLVLSVVELQDERWALYGMHDAETLLAQLGDFEAVD